MKCVEKCAGGECDPDDPSVCTECGPAFYMEDGACFRCPEGALECVGDVPTECLPNFELVVDTSDGNTLAKCEMQCIGHCGAC